METIIAAAITGIMTLVGAIFTTRNSINKGMQEMKAELTKAQAVTDCRLDELTREVRDHNNFAKRMPVVENEVAWIKEKIEFFHSGKAGE